MTLRVNGVVDRISGDKAVILIESHGKELFVSANNLKPGVWLDIILDSNDQIISLKENHELTKERTAKIDDVMKRLRKRKGSKFKQ